MERLAPQEIAEAILSAPGWARFGLTAATPYLREEAAAELARAILARTEAVTPPGDQQIGLAL